MRVGFFLGYGPQARYGTEGLGRYLGGLIKGFISAGVAVTVAAPVWSRKSLEKLFTELDIPLDAVSFVTNAKSEPFVWKVYKWLVLKERKSRTGLMKKLTKLLGEAAILFTKTSTEGFAKYLPEVRILAVYGGANIEPQIRALKHGVDIIVATPGRLVDLMTRKKVAVLDNVRQDIYLAGYASNTEYDTNAASIYVVGELTEGRRNAFVYGVGALGADIGGLHEQ